MAFSIPKFIHAFVHSYGSMDTLRAIAGSNPHPVGIHYHEVLPDNIPIYVKPLLGKGEPVVRSQPSPTAEYFFEALSKFRKSILFQAS